MLWAAAALILAGALGAALLVVGARGRRVDDHAVCARCRFDLTGGVGSVPERCPECGGELDDAKSVRTGNRRRRRWAVGWGGGLLAVALLAGGGVAWVGLSGFNWAPHAPSGVLIWHARVASAENAEDSLEELASRAADGELRDDQIEQLIADGLALQADDSRAWKHGYASIIEWAALEGRLDAARLQQYTEQALELEFEIPDRVRAGTIFRCSFSAAAPRGTDGSGSMRALIDVGRVSVDGDLVREPPIGRLVTTLGGKGRSGIGTTIPDLEPPSTTPAEQLIEVIVRTRVYRAGDPLGTATPLVEFERRMGDELRWAAPDEEFVELVDDSTLAAALERSLSVDSARFTADGRYVELTMRADDLPATVAFEIFDLGDEGEASLGAFTMGQGYNGSSTFQVEPGSLKPGLARLRFVASRRAAERVPGFNRIWNGSLTFDVEIEDAPPSEDDWYEDVETEGDDAQR